MRRSSIITIILLVLIIIGLTVALVVTNLPKNNEEDNVGVEDNVNQDDSESDTVKSDEPKQVDLNSNVAVELANILQPSLTTTKWDFFYEFQKEVLNQENMSNTKKLEIAFDKGGAGKKMQADQSIAKSDMDDAMKKIFGNSNYNPESFNFGSLFYSYDNTTNCFKLKGNGGGGQGSHYIAGVYKIDEYSNRYEVYSKALVIEFGDYSFSEEFGNKTLWYIKNADSTSPEYEVGHYYEYSDTNESSYETIESIVNGISPREFVQVKLEYGDYTNEYKLLTKYYDQAMEYKHTFMKNEDGSYYWVKSEIL